MLIQVGVGQLTRNEWLPMAAIATPITLSYLVNALASEDLDIDYYFTSNKKVKEIALSVYYYFEQGKPLQF